MRRPWMAPTLQDRDLRVMTITGGSAGDARMENAADVMTGGSGMTPLPLFRTCSAEQYIVSVPIIINHNGSANSAVQVGFEVAFPK